MDLKKFKCKQILNQSISQKRIFLLGIIEGQQQKGQAIAILTPKLLSVDLQNNPKFNFGNIQTQFINDIYGRFDVSLTNIFQIQTIFPITQKHKKKYQRKTIQIIKETQQIYLSTKQKLLQKQLKHIDWVQNIIDGKAEVERIIYKDENNQFLILPDFKFTDLKDTNNLHLLTIFSNQNLTSIRDLNQSYLDLLQHVLQVIKETLKTKLNLDYQECRVYFHYPPTFYRLHIHITNIKVTDASSCVQRCHQLETVIDNIKLKEDYYQKARLNTFVQKQKKA